MMIGGAGCAKAAKRSGGEGAGVDQALRDGSGATAGARTGALAAPAVGPAVPSGSEDAASVSAHAEPEGVGRGDKPTTNGPVAGAAGPGGAGGAPGGIREDGRPAWWFSEAKLDSSAGGRVELCAEALGVDMAEARRAAVDAGRGKLRRELGLGAGAGVPGEVIVKTWVWPLPNARAGSAHYAGYVMMAGGGAAIGGR